MKNKSVFLLALTSLLAVGCSSTGKDNGIASNFKVETVNKELDKATYINKTLGGLLGQFAGFLSGYEFASSTNPTGLPLEWFDFVNGPYAGNYTYYTPVDSYRYNRLRTNSETGLTEVWSDDDYHIDILNQYVLKEYGFSSFAIKETWKKYAVSDWGGGADAMILINSKGLLAPFTGTIEAGNRYGWCTEAYIENETLGMNAPGMPNLATSLVDKFASNVGYFDSVIWGKYYASMYSFAYFYDDVKVIMEKALSVMPKDSYPYKTYQYAVKFYNEYPNDYKTAAYKLHETKRNLYRIDNFQTDPNVNGGLAILSLLYGKNDYMETAKYSSMMGYDGDCTAAICCGLMGIIKGFKSSNSEYQKINNLIYHNGEGCYHNDTESSYQAKILSKDYPVTQKIDDIVDMYRQNFETLLIQNGGKVNENSYTIPTSELISDHSYLFTNYDAEERTTEGFTSKNVSFSVGEESENGNSHTGVAYFRADNIKEGYVYHRFSKLQKGHTYRLSTYVKTNSDGQVSLYAKSNGQETKITFAKATSLINKTLTFTANSSIVDVGFKFEENATSSDYVIFDDFMLEEVDYQSYGMVSENNLSIYSKKFTKTINLPEGVKPGEEVTLRVQYRNYSSNILYTSISRNGSDYGSVVLSNTSKTPTNGYDYVEIPYIFEKNSDLVTLNFDDSKIYIGTIEVMKQNQYMFR